MRTGDRNPETDYQLDNREQWVLRLYVYGKGANSRAAEQTVRSICRQYLDGHCTIDVVDVQANPDAAKDDDIIAIPTLVRLNPKPVRRLIGDMTQLDRVLFGLNLTDKYPITR